MKYFISATTGLQNGVIESQDYSNIENNVLYIILTNHP